MNLCNLSHVIFIAPGYFPPRLLLMKKTMSMMRTRRAIAHIKPMNQPCVTMSTWSRAYSVQAHRRSCRHVRNHCKFTEQWSYEQCSWKITLSCKMGRFLCERLPDSSLRLCCQWELIPSVSVQTAQREVRDVRRNVFHLDSVPQSDVHYRENIISLIGWNKWCVILSFYSDKHQNVN